MLARTTLTVLSVLVLATDATGQAPIPQGAANLYLGRSGQTRVRPPRVQEEPAIDGRLTESDWNTAALLTGFSQYAPVDRLPADDSTEVRVMYSETAIYFGIRAFEAHGPVIATLADRDRIESNDYVRLFLDTFNDRRRAFLFAVNPLGVQSDGTWAESGTGAGVADLNPDFVFESRGRLIEGGYEIEIRVPYRSLRFQQAAEQRWTFNVLRFVQHSGSSQSWTAAENSQPSFLAQSGSLDGLTDLRAGLVLDVTPVVTAQTVGAPRSSTDSRWQYRTGDPEYSGNVRWGITPNVNMSGTVNPDFSQVEADVGQVIYDPRAAIAFPEKRPFFLDGSENFEVPNTLIYTRSIVSPVAAAKISGKVRGATVGVLSALDDPTTSLSATDKPLFNILRVRRDLGSQSTAGMVFTDRREPLTGNTVFGGDARILAGRYVFAGQLASSITTADGSPSRSGVLFDAALIRTGRARGFSISADGVGPEFEAASGFVSRAGIAHANFTPRWSFFPEGRRVEAVSFAAILDGTWDWDRFMAGTEPNDIKAQTNTTINWRGGWRTRVFTFVESFKYPDWLYADYYVERHDNGGAVTDTVAYVGTDRLPNYGTDVELATPQFQHFAASANVTAGHDENFDEWSSAWILFTAFNVDWRPTDRVRLNTRWVQQRYHRTSNGSLVRMRIIPRVKLEYQVARPLYVRFVAQYDAVKVDSLRDDTRTNQPILIRQDDGTFVRALAQERGTLRGDVLLSYQPNPGTVFFMGYGSTTAATRFEPRQLQRATDGFFVKASYLIRS